jgi:3'-5' exoribonuclease
MNSLVTITPSAPLRVLRLRRDTQGGLHGCSATVWGCLPWQEGPPVPARHVLHWRPPRAAPLPEAGSLVRMAWRRDHGTPQVVRVWTLPQVDPDVDLLQTVPRSWLPTDGALGGMPYSIMDAFASLWQRMTAPWRAWFNALFWHEPRRLQAFLTAPASLQHHHAHRHGLLLHSLDCAVRALRLAQHDPRVDQSLLLMAALVHDVAKAEEYEWDERTQSMRLTQRGELLGHRLGVLEWLAIARESLPEALRVPPPQALALYHAIEACNAPDWVGLRSPRTPEAHYLASVDALSGYAQLIDAHWRQVRRQGQWSAALRRRLYCPVHDGAHTDAARVRVA